MPHAAFVTSPETPYPLREFARAVQDELVRQGVTCETVEGFPAPRSGQVYVLVAPREFLASGTLPDDEVLARTVFLGAERPHTLDEAAASLYTRAGAVFDIHQRGVVQLHRLGIPGRLLRPGYSDRFDHLDPSAERPVDVVFLGAESPRRVAALRELAPVLGRRRCELVVGPDPAPPGEDQRFLAQSRWPLLARAKVIINLHHGDDPSMEWLRMIDAFHAGAVLLTEPSTGTLPFVAGEQFVAARLGSMGAVLDLLLDDPARLQAIRESAHTRLREWLPLAAPVSVLRAALVELVGEPIPADASVGRRSAHGSGDEGEPGIELSRNSDASVDDADPRETELRGVRRELAATRQALARLEQTVAGGPHNPLRVGARTPAWAARPRPAVSLIVETGGDPDLTRAALDSVTAARVADVELIVVASPRSLSATAATRWLAAHPGTPATLLLSASGGEGAFARRSGLALVRGPLSLALRAGQILLPRALPALLEALREDASATCAHSAPPFGTAAGPALAQTARLRDALIGAGVDVDPWEHLAASAPVTRPVREIATVAA